MSDDRPTKRQRALLSFIQAFITQHGYGPSYREIMNGVGYKSVSTVATHVDNLITKKYLIKRDHSARSLEMVNTLAKEFSEVAAPTKAQEKWLVDQIAAAFVRVESMEDPSQNAVDPLYVLVGALQILGFSDPARAFKARLLALKSVKVSQNPKID